MFDYIRAHNFLRVLPLVVVRHSSKISSYAIYRKTNEPNLRKWKKKQSYFGPDFAQTWVQIFFVDFSSTRC